MSNHTNNGNGNGEISPSQKYIDRLIDELNDAKRCLDEALAEESKASAEYLDAVNWCEFVNNFLSRIQSTIDHAKNVIVMIESAGGQANLVCQNIKCTLEALQILTLEAKESAETIEILKQKIKKLLDQISCINDPVLDPNVSLLKCIQELKAAVDAAMAASLHAIWAILNAVKALNELLCMICENDMDDNPIDGSLIQHLNILVGLIKCGESSVQDEVVAPGSSNPDYEDCTKPKKELNCAISPLPCLCPDECDSTADCSTKAYLTDLIGEFENAKDLKEYKKCIFDKAQKARIKAQARHDALSKALEAAKAAKNC
jgi:hypothetical protein